MHQIALPCSHPWFTSWVGNDLYRDTHTQLRPQLYIMLSFWSPFQLLYIFGNICKKLCLPMTTPFIITQTFSILENWRTALCIAMQQSILGNLRLLLLETFVCGPLDYMCNDVFRLYHLIVSWLNAGWDLWQSIKVPWGMVVQKHAWSTNEET